MNISLRRPVLCLLAICALSLLLVSPPSANADDPEDVLASPGRLGAMGFAYHSFRDLYFMYGGRSDGDVALDDTWQFNPVTVSWTLLPADTGTGRSSTRMVYNPTLNFPLGTGGILVLYGGTPLDANTRFYDGSAAGDWQLCTNCAAPGLDERASEGLA